MCTRYNWSPRYAFGLMEHVDADEGLTSAAFRALTGLASRTGAEPVRAHVVSSLFRMLVLGCINTDFGNQTLILQYFSRSRRLIKIDIPLHLWSRHGKYLILQSQKILEGGGLGEESFL